MRFEDARGAMREALFAEEARLVDRLADEAASDPGAAAENARAARHLVERVRAGRRVKGGVDAFLQEYGLTDQEGVALMCLAEALLRVPDAATADRLIRDKLGDADFERHKGRSDSLFVNASTWALMLTGRVVRLDDPAARDMGGALKRLVARSGEPVIRNAVHYAMRILGEQFVLGRTISEALSKGRDAAAKGYRFSYDMLGEAAHTAADAARYFKAYADAIAEVGRAQQAGGTPIWARPSVSVKLSALHPCYEQAKHARVMAELAPQLVKLAEAAKAEGIGLTIDAEETDRLEISFDLLAVLARAESLRGWNGLGLALQAYQRRARPAVDALAALARETGRTLPLRLVKGAYWDSEIKRAQEQGLPAYPVFTRKVNTDVSYLACAKAMLEAGACFHPQFATHNAQTLAAIATRTRGRPDVEFQRLHGMGAPLYDAAMGNDGLGIAARIYAPVGGHEDLLAYLVRRLLENGANTSFVNRLADDEAPIAALIADPVETARGLRSKSHPRIPAPADLFPGRRNAAGIALWHDREWDALSADVAAAAEKPWAAPPVIGGETMRGSPRTLHDPADTRRTIGTVIEADAAMADRALSLAAAAQPGWDGRGGPARAVMLERAADLFEARRADLIALCVREAGKTVANALADIREAVDFLRYYAAEARSHFAGPVTLPGPTGEANTLSLHGRGIFACIAPWNFPVAIFTGQAAAALAAGNAVIAKPAEQTPLSASLCVALLHEAGVPRDVLHLLPGSGESVGAALTRDRRVAGVAFTGSNATAQAIARSLAARDGPLPTLIAETGGLNAMVVDSTALPEQVARDAVTSAFDSAGQRCSALRLLFVQEDVAPRVLDLIAGAIAELRTGDPMRRDTDVGPLIDADAKAALEAHLERLKRDGRLIARAALAEEAAYGTFLAPQAWEIPDADWLDRETFGPILHVVRWKARDFDAVCAAINASGYGLTAAIQTRIAATAAAFRARVRAGNLYVNRNQIGAVVGAQPFGGEGLSGTGPKAGGPHYLHRFAVERVVSENTTASGGNAALLTLDDLADE